MKHLGFTIQFLLLLLAIPVLMYVELTRDSNKEESKKESQPSVEVTVSKSSNNTMDPLMVSFDLVN